MIRKISMKTHSIIKEKKYGSLLKMINSWAINLENIREYY